jgi:RimJ/RimL family protein N-acetyltransferase
MLEGKTLSLRIVEKEDLPLIAEWSNNLDFFGEYDPIRQTSRSEIEKMLENPYDMKTFIIEKKDKTKIGIIYHYYVLHPAHRQLEIGFSLVPNERGKVLYGSR